MQEKLTITQAVEEFGNENKKKQLATTKVI